MNYREVTNDRQFKDTTSYSRADFLHLLKDYEATYFEIYGRSYETYILENVMKEPELIPKYWDGGCVVFCFIPNEKRFGFWFFRSNFWNVCRKRIKKF